MGLTFVVEDAPDLTIPEDTIIRARLNEISDKTINWTDRNTNEQKSSVLLEWKWEVVAEGQYKGRKLRGECDAKISNHPRNKFRAWAESLLGRELPMGMGIDTDDLVGLVADISIAHRADRKDPSKKYEYVDEVIPVNGGFSVNDEPPF